jgi:hypothetical protein
MPDAEAGLISTYTESMRIPCPEVPVVDVGNTLMRKTYKYFVCPKNAM